MNELAQKMDTMTVELRGLRLDLKEASDALKRERFWRKVAAVLVVMAFVSFGGYVSHKRQTDCDGVNESRRRLPEAVAAGIGTGYDRYGPDDPAERESLTAEVEADVARLFPERDCSWPA